VDYLAPEIVDRKYYGKAVDNWCLGVLLYEFLVGEPPFEGRTASDTKNKIRNLTFKLPRFLSQMAKQLITLLLRELPESRLSLEDILEHPWIVKFGN
jgi:serine/threonine protein kinase